MNKTSASQQVYDLAARIDVIQTLLSTIVSNAHDASVDVQNLIFGADTLVRSASDFAYEVACDVLDLEKIAHPPEVANRPTKQTVCESNAVTVTPVIPEASASAETTRLHMREIASGLSDLQALVSAFTTTHLATEEAP